MKGFGQRISNFFGWTGQAGTGNDAQAFIRNAGGSNSPNRNLNNMIFPQSLVLTKADLKTLSDARAEADQASWPFRCALQKIYEKTLLFGHVASCVQRRKELTLLRDFEIVDKEGNPDEHWTEYFKKAWFSQQTLELILDAVFHGFTLISIGAIENGVPSKITSVRRWNISPDREHVSIFEKAPAGYSWTEAPYDKWHVWVPTLQTNGINNCGYGLLYITSILEILARNNIQYNTDFIEMFAQPYRHLKTNDLDGDEFEAKKKAMAEMGHAAYLITSMEDELSFLNDGSRGNGYKAYNDYDHRAKSDISKWIGGHADFIDSTPKALGGSQNSGGGDITDDSTGNTPIQKAMAAKRMIDGNFVTNVVNEVLIPKLQGLGVTIPTGHRIHFLNDTEERAIAAQEADKNQKIATLALTFAQGGLKMSKEYAEEATGIEFTDIEIAPDNNVTKDPKEQAKGKDPLKDESKKRTDKPKHTKRK